MPANSRAIPLLYSLTDRKAGASALEGAVFTISQLLAILGMVIVDDADNCCTAGPAGTPFPSLLLVPETFKLESFVCSVVISPLCNFAIYSSIRLIACVIWDG